MKTLFEKFADEEFKRLRIAKKKTGLNWHDFIMTFAEIIEAEIIELRQKDHGNGETLLAEIEKRHKKEK